MTTANTKTRFAPSPTGSLHVGGARTALFNFLLARKTGGTFLLRIEDTDVARHQEHAVEGIIEDMRWLGLQWDEGIALGGPAAPYRQSERLDLYRQYAQKLLDAGQAYYAFETAEELDVLRKEAEAQKRGFKYTRPSPLPTPADAERARAQGRPVVVRVLCPCQDVTIHDDAFGDVTMPGTEMDDFIIVKADGYPTYHLANVVDDGLMGVTYIMRGQEFLGQTWRHVLLRRLLGFPEPGYCHLPLIMNTDNSKMSKREKHKTVRKAAKALIAEKKWTPADISRLAGCDEKAAAAWLAGGDAEYEPAQLDAVAQAAGVHVPEIEVMDFRKAGYLPEVLLNFVALLGWSPSGDREKMSLQEMVDLFGVDRIGKTNAKFDREKLLAFNTDAAAAASDDRLLAGFKDYLSLNKTPIPAGDDAMLLKLVQINRGFRTFADIITKAGVLFVPDDAYDYDPKAVDKVLTKGDGFAVLADLRDLLAGADWTAENLHKAIEDYCAQNNLGMGKVAQPLRVAVTGTTISPAIGETLTILGREKTLRRLDRCLKLK